jgi:transposase-like protein
MNQACLATREKWRQIIESQRAGGQTAAAYCREHGVTQASFFAWKRRLQPTSQTRGFVEINATDVKPSDVDAAEGKASAIEVCLRGGRRLLVRRGLDRELLIEMIAVLEGLA